MVPGKALLQVARSKSLVDGESCILKGLFPCGLIAPFVPCVKARSVAPCGLEHLGGAPIGARDESLDKGGERMVAAEPERPVLSKTLLKQRLPAPGFRQIDLFSPLEGRERLGNER